MNYIAYLGNKSKYTERIYKLLNGKFNKNFIEPFGGSGAVSLYMSKFIPNIFLNEFNENIYKIHYSFKNGSFQQLKFVINEIYGFGNPKLNKEDFYTARNELNKKYFKSNLILEGFYNWGISTFTINSMIRFGPNGFNSCWGNRGVDKELNCKKMNEEKFNYIKKCYNNIKLYNEDFIVFMKRFKTGILFVDPPYIEMNSGLYSFSKIQHNTFINIIKKWEDTVIYTNIFSDERINELGYNWNYEILRNNIGYAKVGINKRKKYETEAIYYNF